MGKSELEMSIFKVKMKCTSCGKEVKKQIAKLNKEYPLVPHTNAGRLFSTVRRMKAEKDIGIPINYRSGFAISVKTGKGANEMTEQEWENFYKDLSEELKKDYPELYISLFPEGNEVMHEGFSAQEGMPLDDFVLSKMSKDEKGFWEDFFAEVEQVIAEKEARGKVRPFAPTVFLKEKYEEAITKYDGGKYCPVKQLGGIFTF